MQLGSNCGHYANEGQNRRPQMGGVYSTGDSG